LPVDRSTYHYRSRRAGQTHLTERIRQIAASRVHYGYRRIHVLLRREGWRLRLYREMGLQLRAKTSKRRVKAKRREDRQLATRRHARLLTGQAD